MGPTAIRDRRGFFVWGRGATGGIFVAGAWGAGLVFPSRAACRGARGRLIFTFHLRKGPAMGSGRVALRRTGVRVVVVCALMCLGVSLRAAGQERRVGPRPD